MLKTIEQFAEIDQAFWQHMNDLTLALNISIGLQKPRMPGGGAVAIVDGGMHDQVDNAGLVFQVSKTTPEAVPGPDG